MRLLTYCVGPAGPARAGVRVGHRVLDIEEASRVKGEPLPSSLKALFAAGRGALARVQALSKAATTEAGSLSKAMHEERAIRLLPPVPDAGRLFCLAANLPAPAGAARAREPEVFVLPDACLVGHDARVAPAGAPFGPELVFVIGRRAEAVGEDEAMDHVIGVTVLDRFGCREPGSPGRASLGPDIVTLDEIADPDDLWLTCAVNGEERLRVNVREQGWKLPAVLARLSAQGPLEPGEMIAMGLAGSAGPAPSPGDTVESAIEGIGLLRNAIATEALP
ncbi:MAG: fumarylacetoacetate hydrolase family protein [Burkholderiales bacterium]